MIQQHIGQIPSEESIMKVRSEEANIVIRSSSE